jgi:hypothetical protein
MQNEKDDRTKGQKRVTEKKRKGRNNEGKN